MSVNDTDLELEDLARRSYLRLLAAEVFDPTAFEGLLDHLNAKARALKAEYVVSKQILLSLRDAEKALRGAYVGDEAEKKRLADGFALLLDLILIGESFEDRRPGRVV